MEIQMRDTWALYEAAKNSQQQRGNGAVDIAIFSASTMFIVAPWHLFCQLAPCTSVEATAVIGSMR